MSKTKSVTTVETNNVQNFNLESLTLEQRAELFAMLRKDATVVTQASAIDEARLKMLRGQKEEIEREIASLNSRLAPILSEIRTITGKNVTAVGTTGERTQRTVCPECNQGRHADNEKTRACSIYPGFKAAIDAAKDAGKPIPLFSEYLASIQKAAPSAVAA